MAVKLMMTRELMENLNALEQARVKYNEALCDNALKRMIKAKVRVNQVVFERGDNIYWRAVNNANNWLQGKVVAVDSKVLFVRKGSQIYRVSSDMAVKVNEEFNTAEAGQEKKKKEKPKVRRPRLSFEEWWEETGRQEAAAAEEEPEQPPSPAAAEEEPEQQPSPAAQRLGLRTEDNSPAPPASSSGAYDGHQQQGLVLPKVGGALPQVSLSNDRLTTNSSVSEVPDSPHHSLDQQQPMEEDEVFEQEVRQEETQWRPVDREAVRTMQLTEIEERQRRPREKPPWRMIVPRSS